MVCNSRTRVIAAFAAVTLTACAHGHDEMPARAKLEHAATEATTTLATVPVDANAWPSPNWWTRFGDPALDALMNDAVRDNPSVALAEARLHSAQAMAGLSKAALSSQVNADASTSRQRLSANYVIPPPYGGTWWWLNQAQVTADYTVDLWGKNRTAFEAAVGRADATRIDALAATLTLTASIAQAYVQLQHTYEQRDVAQATLDARTKVLDLSRNRVRAGLDSQVDLKQAEAAVPAAKEQLAVWQEQITVARDQIAALAGWGPDRGADVARPKLVADTKAILPTQLPAELLGHRPDVAAGRLRAAAAFKDIASAKAAFYPNLDLNLFAGFQSLGLSRFITGGAAVAGVGPALSLPIFDGGRLRSELAGRRADAETAIAQYRQTVSNALQEVADDLAGLHSVDAQLAEQAAAVTTLQEAYDLSVLRYREGLGTYIQVLTAETQLLAQKSLAVDLHARALGLSVNLVASLGGGVDLPKSEAVAANVSSPSPRIAP